MEQPPPVAATTAAATATAAVMDNAAKFAELEREIRRMDMDSETIALTYHLRKFAELFQSYIVDDQSLSEFFNYLNRLALDDSKFAINMATVFASRQLDDLVIKETKLRNAMLTILQENFRTIEELKREGVRRFYNSVTLLGEYYNRKRFVNGKRILILGQSLLLLLTTELEKEIKKCEETSGYTIDPDFAKLILSQMTLNGGEAKVEHRQEVDDLNYSIRKCLINVSNMLPRTKAYLLMALDLFYTNFNLSSTLLEKLYGKHLFEPDEDTSTKGPDSENKVEKRTESSVPSQPAPQTKSNDSSSKTAPKKTPEKTDNAKKHTTKSGNSAKPRKKEVKADTVKPPPNKSPITSPKKPSTNTTRKPTAWNQTSPKKDQRAKPASVPKTPPQRKNLSERLKPVTPDQSSPKNHVPSPKPAKTPENPSVLKQNCKPSPKSAVSPGQGSNSPGSAVNMKLSMPSPRSNHEDNVENLAWDDLTLDDESPQKLHPHTKSFLNFLAQK